MAVFVLPPSAYGLATGAAVKGPIPRSAQNPFGTGTPYGGFNTGAAGLAGTGVGQTSTTAAGGTPGNGGVQQVVAPPALGLSDITDFLQGVGSVIEAVRGGGGGATGGGGPGTPITTGCPTGYELKNGQCVKSGVGGYIERTLPGGQTGTLWNGGGQAVIGAFGKPALVPTQVGSQTRMDGTVNAILRCPAKYVLGADDLCYPKGTIPRQYRKWAPRAKPLVSANDAKTLRRIGSIQRRVKKAAGVAGFTCRTRGGRR